MLLSNETKKKKELEEKEILQQQMYFEMFKKGREMATHEFNVEVFFL
jgi:hypothetical protein